ncbi:MAG: hypothetical protein JST13_10790, partial [Bacteroidetes bacterium]|nr:hypothetical protein [Bacteroidota bacterium]
MRTTVFIFLSFFTARCFAQDADYNDFRRKNEGFAHIYDKSLRSDLSAFTVGGIEESMGKGKLKEIPVKDYGPNYIGFDSNGIKVTIKAAPFFATRHKLAKEGNHVVKIDNRPFYGNYGKVPSTAIAQVLVMIGNDTVEVPEIAYRDLYNPNFTYADAGGERRTKDAVYLSPDKRT